MKTKFFFVLLFSLVVMQGVFAEDLEIYIESAKDYHLNFNFLNPDRESSGPVSFGSLTKDTGNGTLNFIFNTSEEVVDIDVFIMKESQVLEHEIFEGVETGQKILLFLVPGVPAKITENYDPSVSVTNLPPINVSTVNTTNISLEDELSEGATVNTLENNLSLNESTEFTKLPYHFSGLAIFGENYESLKSICYFVLFGIFLLGVFLITLSKLKKKVEKEEVVVKEKKEEIKPSDSVVPKKKPSLDEAERQLKELQEQITAMKKERDSSDREARIKAAKERLIRDEQELMRLRRGY